MKINLKNTMVTSYDVNGSADDADSFDFVSADERGETEDGGHDQWIPLLSMDHGMNEPLNTVPTTRPSMNFEEIKVTYKELENSDVTEPSDNWFDFG